MVCPFLPGAIRPSPRFSILAGWSQPRLNRDSVCNVIVQGWGCGGRRPPRFYAGAARRSRAAPAWIIREGLRPSHSPPPTLNNYCAAIVTDVQLILLVHHTDFEERAHPGMDQRCN